MKWKLVETEESASFRIECNAHSEYEKNSAEDAEELQDSD